MKKVILCAGALMIGAIGFAQDIPTAPTQATQVAAKTGAAPGANTGEAIQNGVSHKVQVVQIGTENSSGSYQDDGTGTGGNQAFVWQDGNVQPAASGFLNLSEVRQSGTENESTTFQYGDENSALTRQGQNNSASANNKAYIQQGAPVAQQAVGNWAEVVQDGSRNEALTHQTFDNNRALTTQLGLDNKSYIRQIASPNNSVGHAAEADQEGDKNSSYILQEGNGARNNALAIQLGDNNVAEQKQFNTASTGGSENEATIAQGDGYVNTSLLNSIYTGKIHGIVDDVRNGSFNPGSEAGIAFQKQNGAGNDAEIHQFGSGAEASNYAEQEQTQDNNEAIIVQNAFGTPVGGGNYAKQTQNGIANRAGIVQNGIDNRADQKQVMGDNNQVYSTQRGNGNMLNTYQTGDGSIATTAQRGVNNATRVYQADGQSFKVEQGLPPGAIANGSQADVFQVGPNGTHSPITMSWDLQMTPTAVLAPAALSIPSLP